MTFPPNPAASFASDPLIPHDFSGWLSKVADVVRRSGGRMAGVLALWMLIPLVVGVVSETLMVVYLGHLGGAFPSGSTSSQQLSQSEVDAMFASLGEMLLAAAASMVLSLLLAYFTSAGWAAALRIALTDAAGEPISFGQAMAYGARRGLAMWGWYSLVLMCVLVGLCMCVLPGLYLTVVFALFAPVVVCEGGPAMARSLRLVHRAFGAMLGRILFLLGAVALFSILIWVFQSGTGLGVVTDHNDITPLNLVFDGVFGLLSELVVTVVMVAGLLVTYVESRFGEGTVTSTGQLLADAPR
jgi:hypothetical protein